jgi:hypothetical protein
MAGDDEFMANGAVEVGLQVVLHAVVVEIVRTFHPY